MPGLPPGSQGAIAVLAAIQSPRSELAADVGREVSGVRLLFDGGGLAPPRFRQYARPPRHPMHGLHVLPRSREASFATQPHSEQAGTSPPSGPPPTWAGSSRKVALRDASARENPSPLSRTHGPVTSDPPPSRRPPLSGPGADRGDKTTSLQRADPRLVRAARDGFPGGGRRSSGGRRSEEHTSEL